MRLDTKCRHCGRDDGIILKWQLFKNGHLALRCNCYWCCENFSHFVRLPSSLECATLAFMQQLRTPATV